MKTITTESNCEILVEPDEAASIVTLTIFNDYASSVKLTIDECAQLGSALYSIASTHRRHAANDGAIEFRELAVGQRFRFVNHWPGKVCTRIDDSKHARKWHNYAMPDGRTAHTSANAKVIVVE